MEPSQVDLTAETNNLDVPQEECVYIKVSARLRPLLSTETDTQEVIEVIPNK